MHDASLWALCLSDISKAFSGLMAVDGVSLQERIESRAGALAGGEQQILVIGRALMTNPDLLLMDKPTEGLALLLVREVQRAIADLKAQGLAIRLVEQYVSLALHVADYVHVLSRGCIVHSSEPEVLWHNQEVKARYLGM